MTYRICTPYLHAALAIALLASVSMAASAADIAIIVNPQAGVSSISPEDISALFLGKSNAFPGGKIATPVYQTEGALRDSFGEKVLHKDTTALKAYWAKMQFTGKAVQPKELAGDAEMKKFVASNPGAIGYIDKASVDGSVKVVGNF